jgi:outer membrane protein
MIAGLSGCVSMSGLTSMTAPASNVPWTPAPQAAKLVMAVPSVQIPPELVQDQQHWTLTNLLDIGLGNNMQTRAAWSVARTAAAALGIARGSTFPKVSLDLNATKQKGSALGGRFSFDYSSLTPTASLNFLLIDFGGRGAGIEEARQALLAADWTQNAVIQNVILEIEQNYYQYLAAKALLQAQEAGLKEAEANFDAATVRHRAGVATLADTLQAKTALSRAQLDFVSTQGLIQTLKGALASTMGLPANTDYEVADELPPTLPLDQAEGMVERSIAEAQAKRPDLAAARSRTIQAETHIKTVRSSAWPTITVSGSVGNVYYSTQTSSSSLGATLLLDIPLFTGFSNEYKILQAKAEAETAEAELKSLEQEVILQVWTAYYNVKTAAQRIKTAEDLFDAAQQSYQVALGSYKEGVGSILDLLAAQSALESGRIQLIQAKADWLLSLTQFAHDTGSLALPENPAPHPLSGPDTQGEKRP